MKKNLYKIWQVCAISIILLLSIISKAQIAQIIASVCGVIYVLELARENKYSQLFGLVNTVIYAILMINSKVYGTAIYDLVYCVPMLIYTYISWDNRGKNKLEISKCSLKMRTFLIVTVPLLVYMYYIIAVRIGINYALVDAIAIILGAIGMFLIANKKIEQWYCYIIVNVANMALWVIKSIENVSNIPMVAMWVIYIINNIYGLYSWNKKVNKEG